MAKRSAVIVDSDLNDSSCYSSKALAFIVIILLLICWISIFLAHVCFSTEAWRVAFGRIGVSDSKLFVGWLIEGARSTFNIILTVFVLGKSFNREVCYLIPFASPTDINSPTPSIIILLARVAFLLIASLAIYVLVEYHFDTGPKNLAEKKLTTESAQDHRLPYTIYFAYSFILFIVMDVPLLIVPLLGGAFDYFKLGQLQTQLSEKLSKATKPEKVLESFYSKGYYLPHFELLRRYINLNAAIIVGLVLEYFFFRRTLSNLGSVWCWFATALILFNCICVAQILWAYDRGFQIALKWRVNDKEWTTQYCVLSLLINALKHTYGGVWLWLLLVFPAEQLLKILIK